VARKRRTAKERLRQEIERARGGNLLQYFYTHDEQIRRAFALSDSAIDAPVRKAFNAFGLDPIQPGNWRKLLDHLARIHFSTDAPRGAPPKWDERRRKVFEFDVARARKHVRAIWRKHGSAPPTDEDFASYLIHYFPDRYESIQPGTLRKYIASGPPKGRGEK
jgi:hypothetical protein